MANEEKSSYENKFLITTAVHKNWIMTIAILPNRYVIVSTQNFISKKKECYIVNPDKEKIKELDFSYDIFTEERLQFYYNWIEKYKKKML